jgi:hypothetical protein
MGMWNLLDVDPLELIDTRSYKSHCRSTSEIGRLILYGRGSINSAMAKEPICCMAVYPMTRSRPTRVRCPTLATTTSPTQGPTIVPFSSAQLHVIRTPLALIARGWEHLEQNDTISYRYSISITHIPYRYPYRYLIDVRSPISISHIDLLIMSCHADLEGRSGRRSRVRRLPTRRSSPPASPPPTSTLAARRTRSS